MKKYINKKVITETSLYHGEVVLPEGLVIDRDQFLLHQVYSEMKNKDFVICKPFDILNSYIIEHMLVEHNIALQNMKTWGTEYNPLERSKSLNHVDYNDLNNSSDFVLLYGVRVKDCVVNIIYNNSNNLKSEYSIPLNNNEYVLFPISCSYYINNNQKEKSNFIHTINYKLIT